MEFKVGCKEKFCSLLQCQALPLLLQAFFLFIFLIWFVRLLALWPASGDSEDDCGEADGM
jgi:hypothetical protein